MGFISDKQAFDFKEIDPLKIEGGAPDEVKRVWVSKIYIARYYQYNGSERISIDYTVPELNDDVNVIKWDALQRIKNTIGFADRYAVELFPPEEEEIHGIAQRHLWLVEKPDFGLASQN